MADARAVPYRTDESAELIWGDSPVKVDANFRIVGRVTSAPGSARAVAPALPFQMQVPPRTRLGASVRPQPSRLPPMDSRVVERRALQVEILDLEGSRKVRAGASTAELLRTETTPIRTTLSPLPPRASRSIEKALLRREVDGCEAAQLTLVREVAHLREHVRRLLIVNRALASAMACQ